MGLFKEIYCEECGAKTAMLMRTKLVDESYVCNKCKKDIPSYMHSFIDENYSYEDFKYARQWSADSVAEYKSIYTETDRYGFVGMDRNNGLFVLDYNILGKSPYLRFSDVIDFDFAFNPEEFKEGVFSDKVEGNTYFCIKMANPRFYHEGVLEYGAKGKATKSFFGNKVTYEHPKKMVEFERKFIEACIAFMPEDAITQVEDIKTAMSLFMIDDLDATDLNGLTQTRDALLSSFQNGNNEKQIDKINSAYDLLKDRVQR